MSKWYLIWVLVLNNPDTGLIEYEVQRQEHTTYEECFSELARLDAEFMYREQTEKNLGHEIFCTEELNENSIVDITIN